MPPKDLPAPPIVPTPWDLAKIYNAVLFSSPEDDTEAEALLVDFVQRNPTLRSMSQTLASPESPRGYESPGISLWEMARVLFAVRSPVAYPECERTLDWIFGLDDGVRVVRDTFRGHANDLGERSSIPHWPLEAMAVYEALECLLMDAWEHPAEVLDPSGSLGVPVERLLVVCHAWIRRADAETRERLLSVRDRLAAARDLVPQALESGV